MAPPAPPSTAASASIRALGAALRRAKRVVVLCGAGTSTAAGIPDFRSPGTGLYDNLQEYNLPQPEAIFDLDYLRQRPEAFFTLSRHLYPGKYAPTRTHHFLAQLQQRERNCLSIWTQNVDTLERLAGVDAASLIEAHGSFAGNACIDCHAEQPEPWMKAHCLAGTVAHCPRKKCRRGIVKPNIVFFGEALPESFFKRLSDLQRADLLLVMGTSLQVHPFAGLIARVPRSCRRFLLNLECVGEGGYGGFDFAPEHLDDDARAAGRDVWIEGKTDEICTALAQELGWRDELERAFIETKERMLPDAAKERAIRTSSDAERKAAAGDAAAPDEPTEALSKQFEGLDVARDGQQPQSHPHAAGEVAPLKAAQKQTDDVSDATQDKSSSDSSTAPQDKASPVDSSTKL